MTPVNRGRWILAMLAAAALLAAGLLFPAGPIASRQASAQIGETPGFSGVPADGPCWGKGHEELSYRLTFLGVTAGYARFSIKGKTIVDGRQAWHLHVRGWTSQFLSVFYPVNNIMDYYLDVKTLAPIRIDTTKNEKKKFTDRVALYDQEKGEISYWDRSMKNLEKKVEVVPDVHDPVSAVYYFRAREVGNPEKVRNMYAGRKMWQIASQTVGTETIPNEMGQPVETIVVKPVIRRDGKLESKGDIKLWLTNDARRIPIRIYADIKFGTVVGQLIPPQAPPQEGG